MKLSVNQWAELKRRIPAVKIPGATEKEQEAADSIAAEMLSLAAAVLIYLPGCPQAETFVSTMTRANAWARRAIAKHGLDDAADNEPTPPAEAAAASGEAA